MGQCNSRGKSDGSFGDGQFPAAQGNGATDPMKPAYLGPVSKPKAPLIFRRTSKGVVVVPEATEDSEDDDENFKDALALDTYDVNQKNQNAWGSISPTGTEATALTTPGSIASSMSSSTPRWSQSSPANSSNAHHQHHFSQHTESPDGPSPGSPPRSQAKSKKQFTPLMPVSESCQDDVIPEEEDPEAPSDEEDFREEELKKAVTKNPMGPQMSVKLQTLRKKQHKSKTIASPAGTGPVLTTKATDSSLHPQQISHFQRLKLQVKLAEKEKKRQNRLAKLEDRLKDVQGYRKLWEDYKSIEQHVTTSQENPESPDPPGHPTNRHQRSNSFDLKDADSWYFDFQKDELQLEMRTVQGDALCDEQESQASLSLLSAQSLESQRRLFAEKRRARKQKKHAKKSDSSSKEVPATPSTDSIISGLVTPSTSNTNSRRGTSLTRSGSLRRNDYGPVSTGSYHGGMQYEDYHHQPGSTLTDMEVVLGGTPLRQRNLTEDDASSMVSDLNDDHSYGTVSLNDYRVVRRGRHHGPSHHHSKTRNTPSGPPKIFTFDRELFTDTKKKDPNDQNHVTDDKNSSKNNHTRPTVFRKLDPSGETPIADDASVELARSPHAKLMDRFDDAQEDGRGGGLAATVGGNEESLPRVTARHQRKYKEVGSFPSVMLTYGEKAKVVTPDPSPPVGAAGKRRHVILNDDAIGPEYSNTVVRSGAVASFCTPEGVAKDKRQLPDVETAKSQTAVIPTGRGNQKESKLQKNPFINPAIAALSTDEFLKLAEHKTVLGPSKPPTHHHPFMAGRPSDASPASVQVLSTPVDVPQNCEVDQDEEKKQEESSLGGSPFTPLATLRHRSSRSMAGTPRTENRSSIGRLKPVDSNVLETPPARTAPKGAVDVRKVVGSAAEYSPQHPPRVQGDNAVLCSADKNGSVPEPLTPKERVDHLAALRETTDSQAASDSLLLAEKVEQQVKVVLSNYRSRGRDENIISSLDAPEDEL